MPVTIARGGTRIVPPAGGPFAPTAGRPDHRLISSACFAPPKGEPPGVWPIQYFYDRVLSVPLAERRTLQVGHERLARARLSEDYRNLEDVEVLLEGMNRRIVLAPDGTLLITGADRFRFYESDVDGPDQGNVDTAIRRMYSGRVARIHRDGTIPVDNPFLTQPPVAPDPWSSGHRDPEGPGIGSHGGLVE